MTITGSIARRRYSLVLPLLGALLIGSAPAYAQTGALETLRAANSELAAGKHTAVINRLDEAIGAGQMSQSNMARALYLRGTAKQAVGRTAEAIADLNSAIWFRKLPSREQKAAIAQRQKAYQKSGIKPPTGSPSAPATTNQAASRPTGIRSTVGTSRPIQHKVARPILSSSRLPEGQKRKITPPNLPPQQAIARSPARTAQPQQQPQQSALPAQTSRQPVPKWSQVVTGTVPPAKQSVQAPPRVSPTRPANAAAAIPRFRQITVPNRPNRKVAASPGTPVKTWSPLTQQFSSPPPEPASQKIQSAAAVAAPVRPAPSPPTKIATIPQQPAQPAPRPPEPSEPAEPSAGTTNISSLLFGGSAPPKSDAIAAADQLQAERRARIQAHNKRFESQ